MEGNEWKGAEDAERASQRARTLSAGSATQTVHHSKKKPLTGSVGGCSDSQESLLLRIHFWRVGAQGDNATKEKKVWSLVCFHLSPGLITR